MDSLTPMMKQYVRIKAEYQDCILFFRMGDFYEMFFEDAKVASRILEIALTSREKGAREKIPLCGIPIHAATPYIAKLIDNGYKVAICEQVSDPKAAKGLVEREVTQVITPGMVLDGENLRERENNFLVSLCRGPRGCGLTFLDLSTGEFKGCLIDDEELLLGELLRNSPREAITTEAVRESPLCDRLHRELPSLLINFLPDDHFTEHSADLTGGLLTALIPTAGSQEVLQAARAALRYVYETQKTDLAHIKPLSLYQTQDFMILDETTHRNLELFPSPGERGSKTTLLGVLDETITAMGGRKLRNWLSYPLLDVGEITRRQDVVAELKEDAVLRSEIRDLLEEVSDLERLNARVTMGKANPRDLVSLKATLKVIPNLKERLVNTTSTLLGKVKDDLDPLEEVVGWIEEAVVDDPPIITTEGGIIRDGFNGELDELRGISRDGKTWIAQLELQERERTGISSLKVRYNQVFGYYIEVTKANLALVPDDFVRKQTLTNAERFITPQLKEYESRVLGAEERIKTLEHELFRHLRERVAEENRRIQRTASALAMLDALQCLADVAHRYGYNRPHVTDGDEVIIHEGRHPVVERMGQLEPFVPNDAHLDSRENQLVIITGPNMAGKSTYIRQVALIVLMAQTGAFVPARDAVIGLVDRIFTRVGASDNLVRGESTFMVEMRETATIVSETTARSLVVLDEIGRGTSTYDGLSLAWAVAEYLHDRKGPKTLFATHYHELTELAMTKPRVRNYNVAVREWNGEIIFLRRIVEGGTSRSYGIQVARLAGLPSEVLERAKEILANLEKGELDERGLPRLARSKGPKDEQRGQQLTLFGSDGRISRELRGLDPNQLSPLEALNLLYKWKQMLEEEH